MNVTSNMYADDIAILREKAHCLQAVLDHFREWCTQWKITINLKKNPKGWRNSPRNLVEIPSLKANSCVRKSVGREAYYEQTGIYV